MGHRQVIGYYVGDLKLYELAGHEGRWFCTLADLTYVEKNPDFSERLRWTVPAGTLTDFASVPRVLWSLFPPIGKHTRAAVVHDAMCDRKPFDSATVHAIFKRGLTVCGCSTWTRTMFWLGVRVFGPRFTQKTVTATPEGVA